MDLRGTIYDVRFDFLLWDLSTGKEGARAGDLGSEWFNVIREDK
jgi:hypothetical protein